MAATILIIVSVMALLVTGGLAVLVMRDPLNGFKLIDHHVEQLPEVFVQVG